MWNSHDLGLKKITKDELCSLAERYSITLLFEKEEPQATMIHMEETIEL